MLDEKQRIRITIGMERKQSIMVHCVGLKTQASRLHTMGMAKERFIEHQRMRPNKDDTNHRESCDTPEGNNGNLFTL